MNATRIGIIGMGPRGLSILERIVANERQRKSANLEVLLFDPREPGVGCHDPAQSPELLVNTVAGQITMFSDDTVRGAGPVMKGPSFHQWLQDPACSRLEGPISADSYYPRSLFGRYLHWVYRYLCGLAPDHVKLAYVKTEVSQVGRLADGSWQVQAQGANFHVDFLYLTTGHTQPRAPMPQAQSTAPSTRLVDDPYPAREKLALIEPGSTVAIEGLGLTTFDVLAELTAGRGGRYLKGLDGRVRYMPSGNEPRILAYSRSGVPLTARAVNQKGVSVQYKARFLLADRLRELRATRKLDFVLDVLPLLFADMQYAYGEAYLRERRDPLAAMLFCNQFVCADAARREALIEQYIPEGDRLSWDALMNPVPPSALASREDFSAWLQAHIAHDLREAAKGNLDSPLKAACDVLRDLRDTLRAAIDFAGLTEASHRWLMTEFVPVMNRLAVGPPSSRIAEMQALMDAGVLVADFGPGARCEQPMGGGRMRLRTRWGGPAEAVDTLIKARISMHSPQDDASPLLRGLLQDGHVRLFLNGNFHPGGIEVDRNLNWVARSGDVYDNAWALGVPTEGVKFYTFVVPRTGVNSTALVDAGQAVGRMLATVRSHQDVLQLLDVRDLPTEEDASAFASLYGML